MQLIDTHTHLYLPEFDTDRDEAVKRAISSGVVKMLMPNIDIHSVDRMLSAANRYPGICYPMIGLHPTSVREDYLSQLDKLETLFSKHKFVAIGEIGIDLFWDKTFLKEQIVVLRRQIEFAIDKGLPVVIHSRDSFPEVFSVLDEFKGKGLKGVLHAFSGNIKDAEKAIGIGFKLGTGGIVTFKNSGLDKVVKETGPENLILESDSPYLAPVPFRGKRNESSYICIINKKLAEIFGMSEEKVASVTFVNSTGLFNL
ncbi:MAG: TatD family deoxyribonuclease [Bacteroidetes bacterium]|nr:MAG: TatD family deoxyribonuclease [Bacteroidota bacterium]